MAIGLLLGSIIISISFWASCTKIFNATLLTHPQTMHSLAWYKYKNSHSSGNINRIRFKLVCMHNGLITLHVCTRESIVSSGGVVIVTTKIATSRDLDTRQWATHLGKLPRNCATVLQIMQYVAAWGMCSSELLFTMIINIFTYYKSFSICWRKRM